MKKKIQKIFADLINKHGITIYGERPEADIYEYVEQGTRDEEGKFTLEKIKVLFNDEHMAYVLAGHISGKQYDEMEANLLKLGLEIADCDGNFVEFTVTEKQPEILET